MITESEVSEGEGSAEGDGIVAYWFERIVIAGQFGFRGTAGREWERYQAKTIGERLVCGSEGLLEKGMGVRSSPRWPNLLGSELAPATAKRGEEKKVFRAASIVDLELEARYLG